MKRTKAWKPPVASARASTQRSPAAAARPPAISGSDTDGTWKPPVASVHAMTADLGVSGSGREGLNPLPESYEAAMCDGTNVGVLSGKGSALKAELTQTTLVSERVIADSENESGTDTSEPLAQEPGPSKRTLRSGRVIADSENESLSSSPEKPTQKTGSTNTIIRSEMVIRDSEDESSDDDAKDASTSGTLMSSISVAVTPARKAESSSVAPSPATASELGTVPRRSRRSAAVVAAAKVKRTYETDEESSEEANKTPKKTRRESKEEADEITSHQGLTPGPLSTRGKGKAPATPISHQANMKGDVGRPHIPAFDGGAGDGESASSIVDKVVLSSKAATTESPLGDNSEHQGAIDEEVVDIDPINTLVDDEYIPFDDDEDESDDVAPLDGVVESDIESLESSRKKRRIQTAELNAAQWVQEYDESHPVDADDADVQRFETKFACLIENICNWTVGGSGKGWHSRPRSDREMTIGFFGLFRRVAGNPSDLARICLEGMPRQTRKIFGKADLCEKDLLDLPAMPATCKHRLVYMDVATRLENGQIRQVMRDFGTGAKLYKQPKQGTDLKSAAEVRLYVGSSVNKRGGERRTREHVDISNRHVNGKQNLHYGAVRKPDTLCNFRVVGVWQNPYADNSYDGQDIMIWVAHMVEALVMAYLGLYTEANRVMLSPMFSTSSYELVRRIRDGLGLPDFSNVSLNRAWPLCQGTPGRVKKAMICGNPQCRRPRVLSKETLLGTIPCDYFKCPIPSDLTAAYYCTGCYLYFRKHEGETRTREGLTGGRWRHETDFEAINKVWIDQNQRKCHNAECRIPIHSAANLYGIENGIRCLRCHTFAALYRQEYSPLERNSSEQTGECQVCRQQNVRIFSWEKLDVRNDPDLPSELCGSCYIVRCSFLEDGVPSDVHPVTIPGCGNAACWERQHKKKTEGESLVENINEHLWRCKRCDYCHEVGVEGFAELESLPDPPSGPIVSHRFNSTKCIDCERYIRYISYTHWQKADGGYRCANCVGHRCVDCNVHPALARPRLCNDGQLRCRLCEVRRKGGNSNAPPSRRGHRAPPNRRCCNIDCNKTALDGVVWRSNPENPSQYRCDRCDTYFNSHGTEWRPICHNESCDKSGHDVPWRICKEDGNCRCEPCARHFRTWGIERICQGTCHNFNACGNDYTTYNGAFSVDVKGDGLLRCLPCHNFWQSEGRQFERKTVFQSLTREQQKARVCTRPGCNATNSTAKKLHRWKEFVSDGWVCNSCFKELKAMQNRGKAESGPATASGSHAVDEDELVAVEAAGDAATAGSPVAPGNDPPPRTGDKR